MDNFVTINKLTENVVKKITAILILSVFTFNSHAWMIPVGSDPYSIDGYSYDWRVESKNLTNIDLEEFGLSLSHSLQYETWCVEGGCSYNRTDNTHDIFYISYDRTKGKVKDLAIKIQYMDRDTGDIKYFKDKNNHFVNYRMVNLSINPTLSTDGDNIYEAHSAVQRGRETLELLLDKRPSGIFDDVVPVITVYLALSDSEKIEQIYNNKKKLFISSGMATMASNLNEAYDEEGDDEEGDDGYSMTVSVVGSLGFVAKGFQVATDFEDINISVINGYSVGSLSSFQGEIGIWETGDISELSNGKSINAAFDTPVGGIGLLSNKSGSIKGLGISIGHYVGLPVSFTELTAEELGTTITNNYTSTVKEDSYSTGFDYNYDYEHEYSLREDYDDDRDRDRDYDREDEDHDRYDREDNDYATETDLDSGETTRVDFPGEPSSPRDDYDERDDDRDRD
ncbi:hypothetical protein QWZ04_19970 [Vibrio tapetis subsp. quintayensis]|uniref:hypothetical protein n=1 Tax=Vibrio tapetis TaxID=52443 RepID=UPI0025B5F9F6|nr:hypothetical protein [Vibrio tapetis]MDN3682589.1 hypothetical protein [Vibrio tapetis subsp. quintayensis]